MRVNKIIFTLVMISFSKNLIAQIKTDTLKINQLEQVIITGTRTQRNIAILPLPSQIITGESIRKTGLSRLNEIIQEQTGLITVPDFGGGQGIQMQGLDAAYVMILIDGQPLFGRSAGTLDLSRISVNNIERIEIIKGASSSLYGSEALAGVINIITKKVNITDKLNAKSNYKLESFNTHDLSNTIEYGKNRVAVEWFANYFKTNGYNLTNNDFLQTVEPFQNLTIHPKIKIEFAKNLSLSANSRIFNQHQDYKSEIGTNRYSGEHKINEWNNSLLLDNKITENFKLIYDLYVTNYKANQRLNDIDDQLFEKNQFNQWFFRPEIRSHYQIGKNTFTSGIGINYETLNRTYFQKKASLNSEYIFGQMEWFIEKKWNILMGFRYDNHHQYQSQLSPKIALNFKWNEVFSIKSSIGYGYKAPDFRQLYFDFNNSSVGYTVLGYNVAEEKMKVLQNQGQVLFSNGFDFTSGLKPESSLNFNLGAYYKQQRITIDYNIFYNRIKNLIDTKAIAQSINGQNIFSYFNLNEIFTYGLELNSIYRASSNFSVTAGYQFLIAKDQNIIQHIEKGEIFARDPIELASFKLQKNDYFGLFNRSKHTANIKFNYLIPSLKASINTRIFYRSKYGLFDTNNNSILDHYDTFVKGYFVTNTTVNKEFTPKISWQIGVNNLFNYTDKQNITHLPGRQFFTRIHYHF